ncbi:50S ribosomal protein L17 [Bacteroidia bacterium]|nr:50S ribosomal protein L17 [Bacteroidia bacterium]
MRHAKKINHLGRTNTHRYAMLSNMACSLIKHKRISTTLAKAKALRVYVEPLITKSKAANNQVITPVFKTVTVKHSKQAIISKYGEESQVQRKIKVNSATSNYRIVFSKLKDNEAVKILFGEIAQKIADRPGGYTRILKTGFRQGDDAETCIIELVDYNQNMLDAKENKSKTATTRRSRRGGKKNAATAESTTGEVAKKEAKVEIEEAKVVEEVTDVEEISVETPEASVETPEAPEESAPEAGKNEV